MKIKNHIAYRFLTDETMGFEIVTHTYPDFNSGKLTGQNQEYIQKVAALYDLVRPDNQRAYYITESVIENLDMLSVKRKADGNFDWAVFNNVSDRKITLIMPDNSLVRISFDQRFIEFCFLKVNELYNKDFGEIKWVLFFFVKPENRLSENFNGKDVKEVDEFVYKILCFLFLSENKEDFVPAGARYGTKKSGKIVNESPFHITVVTSKWNTTIIRTEGFPVSGHFRLQPYKSGTKMIFIEPFEKKGYIRRANKI